MVVIRTKNTWKANQKNILPYVGEVTYDENAGINVSEENAEKLIQFSSEFYLFGGEEEAIKEKSESSEELGKSEKDDISPQTEDNLKEEEVINASSNEQVEEEDKEAKIRKKLEQLSVKDIKKDYLSQFDDELVAKLSNKAEYIDFIVEQLLK